MQKKTSEREHEARNRAIERGAAHLKELQAMGFKGSIDQLQELEEMAHKTAEQECNGEVSEEEANKVYMQVETLIGDLFGGVPLNFFINTDPRGYALKLKDGTGSISYKDWGGYEILAPDILAEELAWARN